MPGLLLTDVRIVNEETVIEGDLLIKGGRIDMIGGDLAGRRSRAARSMAASRLRSSRANRCG